MKMKKKLVCDPPSGWRYGFPKVIPEDKREGEAFFEWLKEEGYPESLRLSFGNYFYCRYWEVND